MDQSRGERYALAGALSVTTAELLQQVHRVAGGPVADVDALSEDRRSTLAAAASARAAAAACSALVARLLIIERDALRRQLPEVSRPELVEPGVTSVELEPYLWQASLRVVRATRAEVAAAVEQWQHCDGERAKPITLTLEQLLEYADALSDLLVPSNARPVAHS